MSNTSDISQAHTRFSVDKLRLYVLIDPETLQMPVIQFAKILLDAGVRCLQLRQKFSDENFLPRAQALAKLTKMYDALLFINDDAAVASSCGADGVHLGLNDMSLAEVKQRYPELLLGASARTTCDAENAQNEGACYIGCGPIWDAKASKPDAPDPIGLTTLQKVADSVTIPVVAIGGVNASNIQSVFESGAQGAAVIRAVLPEGHTNPLDAASVQQKVARLMNHLPHR